ncbi:MAG: glycoside hydrolase family 2 TIM barrel-domain containing protein, partial [bacterium]
MRTEKSLNGSDWQVGDSRAGESIEKVKRWYPAVVPGNVRLDLLRADIIPDPFYGDKCEESKWVNSRRWWFRKEFQMPPKEGRAFIRFSGLDYHAMIELNGAVLCEHVGMFSTTVVEITRRLQSDNRLVVCFEPPARYPDRTHTLKCQMSYGWDFAPDIRTVGIWDDVSVLHTGSAFLRHVTVHPHPVGDDYLVDLRIEIDSSDDFPGVIEVDVEGLNFPLKPPVVQREMVQVHKGKRYFTTSIPIENPHLWEPWEEGNQWLYRLRATLSSGEHLEDVEEVRFGLRSVEMIKNEENNIPWTFRINGKRKFIRGANWAPCDSFPGRIDGERYKSLLGLARSAGINMLRVWGGGLREKRQFYELCDEMGIMVWQEFPFACASKPYPRTAKFMELVEQEARGIVRLTHAHPSVVFYCGGNEISYRWNHKIFRRIGQICSEEGGGRPFNPHSPARGEAHNWNIHHCYANIADYRKEDAAFVSEFGMQSAPAVESLRKFIPEKNLYPIKPIRSYFPVEFLFQRVEKLKWLPVFGVDRQTAQNSYMWYYRSAQLSKMFRYARITGFDDLESFVEASQMAQAFGLQAAIEHLRRRRYRTSGAIFWQFNEPWPAISWSVVDYYLVPKKAYEKIKQVCQPVLVSIDYPLKKYRRGDKFGGEIFIINDVHQPIENAELRVSLCLNTVGAT